MYDKMAQIDCPIRRAEGALMAQINYSIRRAEGEGAFGSPYRIVDLGHFDPF